jgi:hypothetical protein
MTAFRYFCAIVGRKTRSSAGCLHPAIRLYLPWIAVPRECCQLLSRRMTKQPRERPSWQLCQLPDGMHVDLGQTRARCGAHAPDQLHRQVVKEVKLNVGIDNHEPIGLGHLRGNFSQVLGACDADRDWQAKLVSHTAADRACNVGRRTEEMAAASDVSKCLVDRDPFEGCVPGLTARRPPIIVLLMIAPFSSVG